MLLDAAGDANGDGALDILIGEQRYSNGENQEGRALLYEAAPSGELTTTVITYEYDPLYRLTAANYTGAITAAYGYAYDAAGNMTAYTETVGTDTASVVRVFDDANQLLTSTDTEEGTTSFYYDNNGSLTQILPPGVGGGDWVGALRYGYNQRQLLITGTVYITDTGWTNQVQYVYDGEGNRVQQVDYTGPQPVTTTYTNDNSDLSSVLVATDGSTTTHNLFGQTLISQDDGAEVRTLLADGLGSARIEMAGGVVEAAITYEPFGKLLARTGETGTVYGYVGEQFDAVSGLVYLRARYYNPALKVFLSRDPFPGIPTVPATQHGYSYSHNNPVNFTDPTGEIPFLIPVIVGGAIIGGVTGVTWDVMVEQGKGGIANLYNILNGNFDFFSDHYCDVDWQEALFFGKAGSAIGAVSAPSIVLAKSGVVAGYNAIPSVYSHWLYYSSFKYPFLGKLATGLGTGIGLSDTISDNILRVRALLGDPYAQSAMGEAMATWNPMLGVNSLGKKSNNPRLEPRTQTILNELIEQGDFIEVSPGSMSVEVMAELQRVTGSEFALVRLTDGRRVLVRGSEGRVPLASLSIKRVIAHTHPGSVFAPSIGGPNSPGDVYTVFNHETGYAQHSSLIVTENGGSSRFFRSWYQEILDFWQNK